MIVFKTEEIMIERVYAPGELICADGSEGTEMYVVKSGKVRVFKMMNAEKVELGLIGANNILGELSFLLQSKRTASIEAVEESAVLILERDAFVSEIQKDPKLAISMMKKMAERMKQNHDVIAKLQGEVKSLRIHYGS